MDRDRSLFQISFLFGALGKGTGSPKTTAHSRRRLLTHAGEKFNFGGLGEVFQSNSEYSAASQIPILLYFDVFELRGVSAKDFGSHSAAAGSSLL
jgi:hypothetical protein